MMSVKAPATEKTKTVDHLPPKMIRPAPQPESPSSISSGGENKK